jgi:hypothetical protein
MKKNIFKIIPVLAMMIVMIVGSAMIVSAESYDYTKEDYHCYFGKDHKMHTNFDAKTFGRVIRNMQPGDDVTFKVVYKNNAPETTEWYMENEVEKTLEQTARSAKKVSGTGDPEEGGYTYELTNYGTKGKEVLFNSEGLTLGGREKPMKNREGLEEATNALEDWFHIQTLKSGQEGYLILKIAFEGETEVNDYMDTDGIVNMRFAVELQPDKGNPPKRINTGDYTNVTMWVAILMAAAVLLLIFAIFSVKRDRKDRKEAYDEDH